MNDESIKDLEKTLFNDGFIKDVELHYESGTIINGFISKIQLFPTEIVLCKRETAKNEDPYHLVNLSKLRKVVLTWNDGRIKEYGN